MPNIYLQVNLDTHAFKVLKSDFRFSCGTLSRRQPCRISVSSIAEVPVRSAVNPLEIIAR